MSFLKEIKKSYPDYEEHPWEGVRDPSTPVRSLWLEDFEIDELFCQKLLSLGYNALVLEDSPEQIDLLRSLDIQPILLTRGETYSKSPAEATTKEQIQREIVATTAPSLVHFYLSQVGSKNYLKGNAAEPLTQLEVMEEELASIESNGCSMAFEKGAPVLPFFQQVQTAKPLLFHAEETLLRELACSAPCSIYDSAYLVIDFPLDGALSLPSLIVEQTLSRVSRFAGVVVRAPLLPEMGTTLHLQLFLMSALLWKKAPLVEHFQLWCELYQPSWKESDWLLLQRMNSLLKEVEKMEQQQSGKIDDSVKERISWALLEAQEIFKQGAHFDFREATLQQIRSALQEIGRPLGMRLN